MVDTSILHLQESCMVEEYKQSASIQPLLIRLPKDWRKEPLEAYSESQSKERVHNYEVKSLPHV